MIACTTPIVHVFLIFCTRFTPLIITQHNDSLLTLTDAHGMTRDIQLLCFHATTAQNSHRASPTSPHLHKSQQRKFFHHKLYTLPESTSMIPIKCSQNTRFPVLSLSLYNNSANCQAQQKILTFSQALPQLTEQPLTISCQDPFHLPLYSSPSHVAQNSSPHQTSWSFFFYPSTNRPFLLFFSPDLRYNSKPTLPIRATPSLIIRRRQSASMPTQ